MMRHSFVSSRLLRLSLLWQLCVEFNRVLAANVNVTVDDSDPSILYEPSSSWHANSNACPTCLHPDPSLAVNRTYHFGLHNLTLDSDDFPSTSTSTSAPAASPTNDDDDDKDDDDNDEEVEKSNRGGSSKGKGKRRFWDPTLSQRLDLDDPGFVDTTVSAQFKFNGSAVYLFCLQPQGLPTSSQSPTAMNLTFTLDDVPSGTFTSVGKSSASGYASNISVLALKNLDDKPHVLNVTVGPNSVFALDYIVYTTDMQNDPDNASTSPTPSQTDGTNSGVTTALPDTSPSASSMGQRNVATFAAAVGTSVGVLGTLALCIFISICTRRRRAAQRERRERALDSERGGTDNLPPMIGPRPFVPRYFPGTVPAAPPPYSPLASADSTSSPRASFTATRTVYPAEMHTPLPVYIPRTQQDGTTSSESPSYFDLPPSTTPPPVDEIPLVVALSAPPPFGPVIALPDPPIANVESGSGETESATSGASEDTDSHTESESGTTPSADLPEDGGTVTPPTPPAPELTGASSISRRESLSPSPEPHQTEQNTDSRSGV